MLEIKFTAKKETKQYFVFKENGEGSSATDKIGSFSLRKDALPPNFRGLGGEITLKVEVR